LKSCVVQVSVVDHLSDLRQRFVRNPKSPDEGFECAVVVVMGEFRVELSGFTDGMVDRLKAIGLTSEIISWKLRLFVPAGASGPSILAKVMERHPLVRIAAKAAA